MNQATGIWEYCPVRLNPPGSDLTVVIESLTDTAVAAGALPAAQRDAALQAVLQREQSSTTVMPGGIAFPHGRTATAGELCMVLGVFGNGMGVTDPHSVEPLWFVALLLVPPNMANSGYIQTLAHLSRRLMAADVVARLRAARHEGEVRDALREG